MRQSEKEIIKNRFLEKKQVLSREGLEVPSNKELLEEIVKERMEKGLETLPPQIERQPHRLPHSPSPPPSSGEERLEEEARNEEIVKALASIALEKSIPQAVLTARKTGSDFLLDRLHDVLVDKYYQELKNKGVI